MEKLTAQEEETMQVIWSVKQGFIKDFLNEMPEPKPHYNSLATMVKILEDKGFLGHEAVGNIYQYFPVISKEEYQKHAMKDIVSQYFDNSYSNMLAFFAKEQKLSEQELNDIVNIIKTNKK